MEHNENSREFLRSTAVSEGIHVLHDWSGDDSIVATIVRAVTEVTGEEPEECVHYRIDPDGLDALFRRAPGEVTRDRGSVTFPFSGFQVTVHADGMVHLRDQDRVSGERQ